MVTAVVEIPIDITEFDTRELVQELAARGEPVHELTYYDFIVILESMGEPKIGTEAYFVREKIKELINCSIELSYIRNKNV